MSESQERPGLQPGNPLDSSEARPGSGTASTPIPSETTPIRSETTQVSSQTTPVSSQTTPIPSGRQGSTAGEDSAPGRRPRRGIRVRTVVFGLILLAISASVLVALLTTARVDATAVAFVVLIGAGAALLAGGVAAAVREARGGPGA
jgi:hypothetical protein